jgi:hypothetical protein
MIHEDRGSIDDSNDVRDIREDLAANHVADAEGEEALESARDWREARRLAVIDRAVNLEVR